MNQVNFCVLLTLVLCGAVIPGVVAEETASGKTVLLLSQGPDGHPAGTHEYGAGMRILAKCLASTPGLQVQHIHAEGAWADGPALIQEADTVVLFLSEGARWVHDDPRRLEALGQLAQRGGGLGALHWGMGTRDARNIDGCVKLFGGCHGGPDRKYQVLDAKVFVDPHHPVTRGIEEFRIRDEFYYQLKFVPQPHQLQPLFTTTIDGQPQTVAWAWEREDGGRSFGFSGGHFHDHWRRPEYRRLLAQAVLWTLQLPIPDQGLAVPVSEADLRLDAAP